MKVEIQGDAIFAEIEIEAPPDVVFDALVTPEDLAANLDDKPSGK